MVHGHCCHHLGSAAHSTSITGNYSGYRRIDGTHRAISGTDCRYDAGCRQHDAGSLAEDVVMTERQHELHVQIAQHVFGWQWREDWQAWCPPGWPARTGIGYWQGQRYQEQML